MNPHENLNCQEMVTSGLAMQKLPLDMPKDMSRQTVISRTVNSSLHPPVDGQTVDGQTVDGQTVDGQTVDGQTVDGQTVGGQTVDGQTVDGQTVLLNWRHLVKLSPLNCLR